MRKEKYYRDEEFSFLVTINMEVDDSQDAPEQEVLKKVLTNAIAEALEKENLDGVEFIPSDVRSIEPD